MADPAIQRDIITDHRKGLLIAGAGAFLMTFDVPMVRLADSDTWTVIFFRGFCVFIVSFAFWWWLNDFRGVILAYLGVLGIAIYYYWNWNRIGRDPPKGVIVPRWDPPDGISPALTNYIQRKGLDGKGWTAITSALLNLAVNGLVRLENLSGDVKIIPTGAKPGQKLPRRPLLGS